MQSEENSISVVDAPDGWCVVVSSDIAEEKGISEQRDFAGSEDSSATVPLEKIEKMEPQKANAGSSKKKRRKKKKKKRR